MNKGQNDRAEHGAAAVEMVFPNEDNQQQHKVHEKRWASMDRMAEVFEQSAYRWERIVYPSLFAFITLALYGFYLVYSLTSDMKQVSRSIDPEMGTHMSRMVDAIDRVAVNMDSMTTSVTTMTVTMRKMSNELGTMSVNVDKMTDDMDTLNPMLVNMDKMSDNMESLQPMVHSMDKMNRSVDTMGRDMGDMNPARVFRNFMPFM
jgi:hypothetical protein